MSALPPHGNDRAASSRVAGSREPPRVPGLRYHPGPADGAASPRRRCPRTLGACVDVMSAKATYVYCLIAAKNKPSLRGVPRGLAGAAAPRAIEVDLGRLKP